MSAPKRLPVHSTHSTPYEWPGWYRYQSVQQQPDRDINSDVPVAPKSGANIPTERAAAQALLPWRPFYLRRRVLAVFIVIFILTLAAIEGLLAVSNKNYGLATSDSSLHYLWTYGPTAFLTLIAAFWSRSEYQSKVIAPWTRLSQPSANSEQILLLDYLSDFQLFAILKSLRNRDFSVSITMTISLLIKALIIISTGLITLSWTRVEASALPMETQDSFVNDVQRLTNTTALAYYVMTGLTANNLTLPNGISNEYAFQSVRTNLSAAAETHFTVDGLANWLECQPVEVTLLGVAPPDEHNWNQDTMNVTIASPDCNVQLLQLLSPAWSDRQSNTSFTPFARFAQADCDGATDNTGTRILAMSGILNYTVDYSINTTDYRGARTHPFIGALVNSTQLLCTPKYAISKVNVSQNGTQTIQVSQSQGTPNGTLSSIGAGDIAAAQFRALTSEPVESLIGIFAMTKFVNISNIPTDVDVPMGFAVQSQLDPGAQTANIFDEDTLQRVAAAYYSTMTAIIAKSLLTHPNTTSITGSAIIYENRLVIRLWAAQWMAGLVGLCIILAATSLFTIPRRGILPRSPSTLPGLASLLAKSDQLLADLRPAGSVDEAGLAVHLRGRAFQSGLVTDPATGQADFAIIDTKPGHGSRDGPIARVELKRYRPAALHPVSRSAVCILITGLVVSLELTLRKSNNENGLGNVGVDDTYIHYTWTTLPALVLGALAMIISTMDFNVRRLAPYSALERGVSPKVFAKLEFLDMSLPLALYRASHPWNLSVLATSLAFLTASLFTSFSGSLFQALSIANTVPATLHINESFSLSSMSSSAEPQIITSLILTSNLSYPQFTYDDMAFPSFVLTTATASNSSFNASTVSITAVVPAVRAKMDCRIYDAAQIQTNLTQNFTDSDNYQNPLGIRVEGEECVVFDGKFESDKYTYYISTYPNATYFALGGQPNGVADNQSCSQFLFTWGRFNFSDSQQPVQFVSSMGCNVTFEVVNASAAFLGTSLALDPSSPPVALEASSRALGIRTEGFVYQDLPTLPTGAELLDAFFAALVRSPWAVPMAALGDPARVDDVAAAIRRQYGIEQAQMLAAARTMPANATNATIGLDAADGAKTDADVRLPAVVTVPQGSSPPRVVQDAPSTRVLQALLAAALMLLVLGWTADSWAGGGCGGGVRQLPDREPGSIAATAALLAGGNVVELLAESGAKEPKHDNDEDERALTYALGGRGTRVCLGWGRVSDLENEEVISRFGIFAVAEQKAATGYHTTAASRRHR